MKKAVFHMHSTFSHDGKLTITELRNIGLSKGWDYMFLSDHYEDLTKDIYEELVEQCRLNSDDKLQIIPGYEKNWGFDICAFGAYEWDEIDDLSQWAKMQNQKGAFLCLMHPAKYKFQVPEEFLDLVDAVEIWNTKWPYDGRWFPSPQSFSLISKNRIGLAGQDIHKYTDVASVCNIIDTDSINYVDVFQALRKGDFVIQGTFGKLNNSQIDKMKFILKPYQFFRRNSLYAIYKIWRLRKLILK